MNEKNLRPCTPENARERQLKSAAKRKENTKQRKFMSEIYADFLIDKYNVEIDGKKQNVSGQALVQEVTKRVLGRGDGASVLMMKEIREATENESILEKLKIENEKHISKEAEFFQFRLQKRLFDKQKKVFSDFISKLKCAVCS